MGSKGEQEVQGDVLILVWMIALYNSALKKKKGDWRRGKKE